MPTYTFRHTETGEIKDEIIKLADYDQWLKDNPDWVRFYGEAAPLHYNTSTKRKPDDSFRDILRNIKRKHYKTNVNDW